ncbi:MAG: ATP-binding cassette domain-containing protein, partial [Nitrospirae bacterium]|nr:ATP-binding cassette domain-containing protein [Nitrospirota bacterium]
MHTAQVPGVQESSRSAAVPPAAQPCLEATGLEKGFKGRQVVKGVSLDVKAGEVVGLLGPNGAGKTTIFDMMVGLCQPDAGQILLNGKAITDLPMFKRARRGIGYLPQESSVFRRLSVEENILAILEMLVLSPQDRATRLEALLKELDLTALRKSKAYAL